MHVNSKALRQQVQGDIEEAFQVERAHLISKRGAVQDDGGELLENGDRSTLAWTISEQFKSLIDLPLIVGLGISYTRWGRKDCSGSNTQTVYAGMSDDFMMQVFV